MFSLFVSSISSYFLNSVFEKCFQPEINTESSPFTPRGPSASRTGLCLCLLHKCEALRGCRIKPQHYASVIRVACGGIIIISADQKITNNNGHQRGRKTAGTRVSAGRSRADKQRQFEGQRAEISQPVYL